MKLKLNYFVIPLVVLFSSWLGGRFTEQGMTWYKTLTLPSFTPPGWVIGVVWTIIFIMAAASALIVWNKIRNKKNLRLNLIFVFFIFNAVLNVFWSYLFFTKGLIGAAIVEMLVLEVTVLILAVLIWPTSRVASILLWPYAGWVAFATFLATSIFALN